jgi:soluble lytic murein transglycosylase
MKEFYNNPSVQRMFALYAIAQFNLAKEEWWYALKRMSEKQRYIAIKMLEKWNLYPLALSSLSYLSDQNDLTLRYPIIYTTDIKRQAAALNVDPAFIYAIIRQESMFNPKAVSWVGAQGLMQLMPNTAKMLIEQDKSTLHLKNKLTNPSLNIRLGSLYLKNLLNKNDNNPALVAAAYNAGPGRVRQWLNTTDVSDIDMWIDSIPYTETRNYVKRVMTYMVIYQHLLGYEPSLKTVLTKKESQ